LTDPAGSKAEMRVVSVGMSSLRNSEVFRSELEEFRDKEETWMMGLEWQICGQEMDYQIR